MHEKSDIRLRVACFVMVLDGKAGSRGEERMVCNFQDLFVTLRFLALEDNAHHCVVWMIASCCGAGLKQGV